MSEIKILRTREDANQEQIESYLARGAVELGPWTSNIWRHDPRHLSFLLARYKFASKILSGCKCVLDVGCGDGIGIPLLLQEVETVHGADAEPLVIADIAKRFDQEELVGCTFELVDLTVTRPNGAFDGACSLDTIEHIPASEEDAFMRNIVSALTEHAVCIIGTPNATAAPYASAMSREAHINLKHAHELRDLMERYFHNTFIFSMNDEVVHTGFYPMAHYLFAVGVTPR